MKLRWMPQALREIDTIRRHIARDNPAAAREWIAKLQSRARGAATAPFAGRVVPETNLPDVREVFVRTYRIVYRVKGDELQVLTVFEGTGCSREMSSPATAGRKDDSLCVVGPTTTE